ncbi:MAG: hypothetical protein FJ297_09810 [Planctomycetes bacterium]|nr:hypothetical protein [Planctomycetota bacterium]
MRAKWAMVAGGIAVLAACSRSHYRMRADREAYTTLNEKTCEAPWQLPTDYSILPDEQSRFHDPTHPDDPMLPIPAPRLYAYAIPDGMSAPTVIGQDASHGDVRSARRGGGGPADAGGAGAPVPSARGADDSATRVPPLPAETWDNLPGACLRRMFEFASVRTERERSQGAGAGAERRDDAPRLTFENIVELARINNRDYQTQKENLYRAALRLTLARFDYATKFSSTGHRTTTDYRHNRDGGVTVNDLLVPSQFAGDRMLATGGNLLARFANDVVLTFNGASGFATDVGSEILLDLSQALIQRDVRFESLTQTERDLVYAARDFARFRKSLFRNLASQYYNLLLSFRAVEIGSQDYFSTTRAFLQGEAEFQAARLPRVQVDQLEQNSLSSRSRLIGTCNALENDLDNVKILIGLPTETPINLDLKELERLTLTDEGAVLGERVRRARRALASERGQAEPDDGVLINNGLGLAERMADYASLQGRLGHARWDPADLDRDLGRLRVTEYRLLVEYNRVALEQARLSQPPAPPLRVFQRTIDLMEAMRGLARRQLALLTERADRPGPVAAARERLAAFDVRDDQLRADLEKAVSESRIERIPDLVDEGRRLLADVDGFLATVDGLYEPASPTPDERRAATARILDRLIEVSGEMLAERAGGLAAVDIGMDDAMLTALALRYDLMSERGRLADTWRRIKLAGDDLRSILNLRATQSIRTRADVDRVFDFTWDESSTRASLTFDSPLNRKSQRNQYRGALIDYQRSLRGVMAFEDAIKLQIRDDLRQLDLNREQYRIAVASAALAFERVTSTRLQLALNIQNVAARDFLEAQQAYTASLSSVAGVHIRFLLGRIQLFLDTELMQLDDMGFWLPLHDEGFQPEPTFAPASESGRPYGDLPPGVWYSRDVLRMLDVPDGEATIEMRPESSPAEEVDRGVPELAVPPP